MTCEYCLKDCGRYDFNLPCCQIRHITKMPKFRRQKHYEEVRKKSGDQAVKDLAELVKVEWVRLKTSKGNL